MHAVSLPTRPVQIQGAPVLTDRGHAALALYRFVKILRELEPDDRHYILGMLSAEVEPVS